VLDVADLADGGAALLQYQADFTGGEAQLGVLPFLGGNHRIGPGAAGQLAAFTHFQLDVVHPGAEGMARMLSALPGLMSACSLATTKSPTLMPTGARI